MGRGELEGEMGRQPLRRRRGYCSQKEAEVW